MKGVKNTKLEKIVATAWALFWKFGIRRVSIEEICREAGVSKMTFYKHFSNKVQLVKSILQKMTAERTVRYKEIMNQDIPFPEKVKQSIEQKMGDTEDLSSEFFADIHKHFYPEIQDYLDKKLQEGVQLLFDDYVEAQKKGDVRSDIKPEFITYFLNHSIEMIRDDRLMALYDSPQEMILELTNFFFYGILPRNHR